MGALIGVAFGLLVIVGFWWMLTSESIEWPEDYLPGGRPLTGLERDPDTGEVIEKGQQP